MHLAGPQPSSVIGQDVLDILHGIASSELGPLFYLAGGTALALQIRHRRSNDLDYFVDADHLDRTLIWRTADRALSRHGHPDTVLNEAGQVDFAVGPHRRRVSFVAYPFPSARPKVLLEGQRCADVLEIASMKAYALGRRGTARDYVDIEACVSRGGVTLDDII
ncbi:MAG TPA: nucleotidyl transferase AbiEii/AbiGii toxin family protein, partial [Acidimicrobiales bacterium]|nr:nucleotidyl transferase AbiEii/AbiGii toxin family protein [Acidimicrobiales bacterium]